MKGGAVMDERSPLKDAIDLRKEDQEPLFCGDTPPPSSLDGPEEVVLRDGMIGVEYRSECP